jgi:hypothetical protein
VDFLDLRIDPPFRQPEASRDLISTFLGKDAVEYCPIPRMGV